ncbi:MAG: HI0074 family nucleotidyltransferase substrate-binding subunit [Elusimicrobia bacterium]|nr:HI0074 family nucleotidyltransferase substrate-binding subunit [Elusimicrobiota bacterium]
MEECNMALDLSSLSKAIDSLERAIRVASSQIKGEVDTDYEEVIRAGVIQNFEFTYELCWKFIQRWLSQNQNPQDAQSPITRKELFRMAAQREIIKNTENWFTYSEARNVTAHVYDSEVAKKVYAQALPLLADAKYLLAQLKKAGND